MPHLGVAMAIVAGAKNACLQRNGPERLGPSVTCAQNCNNSCGTRNPPSVVGSARACTRRSGARSRRRETMTSESYVLDPLGRSALADLEERKLLTHGEARSVLESANGSSSICRRRSRRARVH